MFGPDMELTPELLAQIIYGFARNRGDRTVTLGDELIADGAAIEIVEEALQILARYPQIRAVFTVASTTIYLNGRTDGHSESIHVVVTAEDPVPDLEKYLTSDQTPQLGGLLRSEIEEIMRRCEMLKEEEEE